MWWVTCIVFAVHKNTSYINTLFHFSLRLMHRIKVLLRAETESVYKKRVGICSQNQKDTLKHTHTHTHTHRPLHCTQVLPLRLRLCWMVAWRGGGGGRGRGRDCREAPITLTRKGPGCGPPISSGREQEGGFRARRIRRCHRKREQ